MGGDLVLDTDSFYRRRRLLSDRVSDIQKSFTRSIPDSRVGTAVEGVPAGTIGASQKRPGDNGYPNSGRVPNRGCRLRSTRSPDLRLTWCRAAKAGASGGRHAPARLRRARLFKLARRPRSTIVIRQSLLIAIFLLVAPPCHRCGRIANFTEYLIRHVRTMSSWRLVSGTFMVTALSSITAPGGGAGGCRDRGISHPRYAPRNCRVHSARWWIYWPQCRPSS